MSHDSFLLLLPAIRVQLQYAFRTLSAEACGEAVQEAVANAFVAYTRLVEQHRVETAAAAPLARFAVAQVRCGRRVGARFNVRDVLSVACRQRNGLHVEPLDRWDETAESWREALVEDRTCIPADLTASRIDFAE